MALDFFNISKGLQIENVDETAIHLLHGAGSPGADDSANVAVGSAYLDNVNGDLWTKILPGAGTDKWSKQASENWVNNNVSGTISWREPAKVINTSATTLPSGPGAGTQDSVTLVDGARVLFTATTPPNVYVWDTTTETFTEDNNTVSQGDTVYVDAGTNGGTRWTYNGTQWVRFDAASLDELGYIRDFIGKTAPGVQDPNYTSTTVVTAGDDLTTAISKLDAQVGGDVTSGNWISASNTMGQNLQAVDTELGPNVTNGNYVLAASKMNANIQALDTAFGADVGTGNFIAPANKVNGNLTALDTKIGANIANGNHVLSANTIHQNLAELDVSLGATVTTGSYITNGNSTNQNVQALDTVIGPNVTNGGQILASNKVQGNIQALDTAIGADVTTGTYVSSANSVNQNLQVLDTALDEISKETTATGVTTVTTIDAVAATVVKWIVKVTDATTPSKVTSFEIFAATNGTVADFTKYAQLKIGGTISGLTASVDVSGANLQLKIASTASVNVVARRVSSI